MTALKIDIGLFDKPANKVNSARLSCNTTRVKGYFVLHLHRLLLKLTCFYAIDL